QVNVDDDELNDIMTTGTFNQVFISNAVKSAQLEQLNERTKGIESLVQSIQIISQMAATVNLMVTKQQENLDEIEEDQIIATEAIQQGAQEIESARWYQKKAFKIGMVTIIIVAIIVIIILAVFLRKK
ncbi:MAG: hypothetical protein MHPSP_002744, partial [Paramarteilia canceri]